MKKYFKKLAALCVTAYAKRIYKQAVDLAELKYKEYPDMYFIIDDPRGNGKLMCIDVGQFLELRHRYNIPSKKLPISSLKKGCWYHTKSKNGKDALLQSEIDRRMHAFIRDALHRAKLL